MLTSEKSKKKCERRLISIRKDVRAARISCLLAHTEADSSQRHFKFIEDLKHSLGEAENYIDKALLDLK